MIFRDRTIVPSIMFHSVGMQNQPWVWSYISEPLELFEKKIRILKNRGYNSIHWHQLYEYMSGSLSLPKDSIFLTFDDGYLDNWVFIYPILKKYGFKGTIYVNPDFVDKSGKIRPNLEDVWKGNATMQDLTVPGFLSWPEMQIMEQSGIIDIQSHALTHTWYYSGPRVLDYHLPRIVEKYPWLMWNERPDRKPYYLVENQSEFVEYGTPILEHQKSLVAIRFFPEPEAVDKVRRYIVDHGVESFHRQADWREMLEKKIHLWFGGRIPGRYESIGERTQRIRYELAESKRIIEENLGKRVDYICWPGGGNDALVQDIARDTGYKSWTLGSQDKSNYRNKFNSNPEFIKRMGSSNKINARSRYLGEGGAWYMLMKIGMHQNSLFYNLMVRLYQLWRLVIHRQR